MTTSTASKSGPRGPVVTSRLRRLLTAVLVIFALLVIDSAYLGAVDILQWWTGRSFQQGPYIWAFLAHLLLGLLITVPLIVYGIAHARRAHDRPNRRAVAVGWALLVTAAVLLVSGYLITRVQIGEREFGANSSGTRNVVFWIHVAAPFVASWFFVLHRLVGRRLRWGRGAAIAGGSVVIASIAIAWHLAATPYLAPRPIDAHESLATAVSSVGQFQPSLLETAHGGLIAPEHLLDVASCQECHPDSHATWSSSVHRFSSFNNPIYAFSVRNTRQAMIDRTGSLEPARFCAGCHDPVMLLSGQFDDPKWNDPDYDAAGDPIGSAGINCIICHAVQSASVLGNASLAIADPPRYPFAFSTSPFLQWVNRQLIRAKPSFHKRTFLKPLHSTAEFCGACHKVFLPEVLNGYKWLPGQNHYDTWRLSGVSGRGVTAWYFPVEIESNCNRCHMPLMPSEGMAARVRDDSAQRTVHHHGFHAGNPAIAQIVGLPEAAQVLQECVAMNAGATRLDLFALREDGRIDGKLLGPIRPELPVLKRGGRYLLETIVRTLKLGHPLTQGTADSNEVWIELTISSNGRVLATSGGIDEAGIVDPWAKFLDAWLLNSKGERIEQRNPEDIFVALYNHQVPPGAADLTHYAFTVPQDAGDFLEINARVRYRKFDSQLIGHAYGQQATAVLQAMPIIELAADRVVLPVGVTHGPGNVEPMALKDWVRWNDYGIGLMRSSGGMAKGQLRQAIDAFMHVEDLGMFYGPMNLGRAYLTEGRIDDAADALARAAEHPGEKHPWSVDWYLAKVERERGALDGAITRLRRIRASRYPLAVQRGYDFGRDERVLVELATTLFERARRDSEDARAGRLDEARTLCAQALDMNPQSSSAWYALWRINEALGLQGPAEEAMGQFQLLRPDDNAGDVAILLARKASPIADHASEPIAIYDLDAPDGQVDQGLESRGP